MPVSPVERPVASAAYSFVRFIGGGLARNAASSRPRGEHPLPVLPRCRRVLLGIVIRTTGDKPLAAAERAQAEDVKAAPPPPAPPRRSPPSAETKRDARRQGRRGHAGGDRRLTELNRMTCNTAARLRPRRQPGDPPGARPGEPRRPATAGSTARPLEAALRGGPRPPGPACRQRSRQGHVLLHARGRPRHGGTGLIAEYATRWARPRS